MTDAAETAALAADREPPLRIAVMGAGAVGCYFGAMLAQGGHRVVLIGRPSHVQAIARDGLRLQRADGEQRIAVDASTDTAAARGAGLVLLCVKSNDTEDAVRALAPHLVPDAVLLTLQNGVDNAEHVRALLPSQRVLASVVYVATEMAGPGVLKHHGRGDLVLERAPVAELIAPRFSAAGVPTVLAEDVRAELWTKLVVNCALNALSAIAGEPYGRLLAAPGIERVMHEVVDECIAVARAEGVALPADARSAAFRVAHAMPAQYASTAQDLARGRRTEIDHLNGLVVRRGEALGVATPVNRALHALVKLLEERRRTA